MFKLMASLFGGPAGTIGSFFVSWAGKALGMLAMVSLIVGALTAIYFSWEGAIQEATAAKYEKAKADALIVNRNNEIRILKDTNTILSIQLDSMKTDQAAINLQSESIQQWLDSQKGTAGDRESSDIIKQTLDRLYGKQK